MPVNALYDLSDPWQDQEDQSCRRQKVSLVIECLVSGILYIGVPELE